MQQVWASCNQSLLPDGSKVLLTPAQWNQYLGDVWYQLIFSYRIPQNGVVVEIAPGDVEKVGLGFHKQGFSGTYYVIEPHQKSLETITAKYKKLMPSATIVPILKTVADAISELPTHVDAIVANHPLDDMIVGKSLNTEEFKDFFLKCMKTVMTF